MENRIVMAPMSTQFAGNGEVTEQMCRYYAARAEGGAGLVIVEAAYTRAGGYLPQRLWLHHDDVIPGLTRLVTAVHRAGARVMLQVNTRRGRDDALDPVSASGVPLRRNYRGTGLAPRILSTADVEDLVREHTSCLHRVREAGFDGLMLHGGHGYLVHEFLSPLTNLRTDKYGGSPDNRSRFLLELVAGATARLGRDFPKIVRLSADERRLGGFGGDAATTVAKKLEAAGVAAIDVVSGALETFEWTVPPGSVPRGCNVPLAAEIRRAVEIPVLVAGRINNPELAEEILAEGKADFVDFGRALLADPDFPRKARHGAPGEIRKCIACGECTNPGARERRRVSHLLCAVNPGVGRERNTAPAVAAVPRKVLVVGAGPAGMEAARVAAARGHEVSLWEKADRLGGQVNLALVPPHKTELANLLHYYAAQLPKAGVRIELGREGTPESVAAAGAEVVVLATGSLPWRPPIPGIESEKVVTASELLRRSGAGVGPEVGPEVVVIGGGLIGCETAEYLAARGWRVTVVEMLPEMAAEVAPFVRWFLLPRLLEAGVRLIPETTVVRVTGKGVSVRGADGKVYEINADTIVLAAGSRPDLSLFTELEGKVPRLLLAGDAAACGNILDAVHHGAALGAGI